MSRNKPTDQKILFAKQFHCFFRTFDHSLIFALGSTFVNTALWCRIQSRIDQYGKILPIDVTPFHSDNLTTAATGNHQHINHNLSFDGFLFNCISDLNKFVSLISVFLRFLFLR